MPLEAQVPQLDTRTFEDLKRQALLRIPRYTPEWTDFNESDPGVTLVELFAWLTEMMLYQMNQVPERNYAKFLQLLGMELRPAQPAVAHLTFSAQPGAQVESVLAGTQIGAQPLGGGDQLIFETSQGLDLIRTPLSDVQVFDGAGFSLLTTANNTPGTPFRPLGWQPEPGSALYLGFEEPQPPSPGPLFPQLMRWRVFLPLAETAGQPVMCGEVGPAPKPPVTLVWEYRPESNPASWRRLDVYEDGSAALTREGAIEVEGPGRITQTVEGRVADRRYWLRVRVAEGRYPAGLEPQLDFIRPNVVDAVNLSTVRDEILGESQGTPNQTFTTRYEPVEAGSFELTVEGEPPPTKSWERKVDLLASGPDDAHYVLNANDGVVRFGDGKNGRIPVAGTEIVATHYRYGGGAAGNVAAGLINAPLTNLTGIEAVTNERAATGGRDEQDLSEFLKLAPARLRCGDRAVSSQDFATLAAKVGGIARAKALPLFHPDHRGTQVPGAITVVVIPDTEDVPPRPSPDQLDAVCGYLESRRLLTTELYVRGPRYVPIQVEATIEANAYAAFDEVSRQVIKKVNEYLSPFEREFGQDFFPTNLFGEIQKVPNVRAVRNLVVRVNGQPTEALNKRVPLEPDEMVYGVRDHEIQVVPYEEQ